MSTSNEFGFPETAEPVVVALSDDGHDDEAVIEGPRTPPHENDNGQSVVAQNRKAKETGPPVKLSEFSPKNVEKYYSELANLIGEDSDVDHYGASDESDYKNTGAESNADDDDEFDPDASEDDKPKSRKRKAPHSPTKATASPPKKRMTGGMRTRINDRIVAVPKAPRKTRYMELKDAFGITKQLTSKNGSSKKKSTNI